MPCLERMWTSCGDDDHKHVAEAMSWIVSTDAAKALARHVEHKHIRAVARQYLLDHPELGIPALAQTARPGSDAYRNALLTWLVRRGPAGALALCQTDAQRAMVQGCTLAPRADVATTLPPVLADPPWRKARRKVRASKWLELAPLEHPESVVWSDEQRAPHAHSVTHEKALDWWPSVYDHDTQTLSRASRWEVWDLCFRAHDDQILEIWNTGPECDWEWACSGTVLQLLARTGAAGIDGWLRNAPTKLSAAIHALRWIRSPRVAPLIADGLARYKSCKGLAREWLQAFPEEAAIGLLPVALTKGGDAARAALRVLANGGAQDTIRAAADRYGAEARAEVDVLLDFDPLDDLPKKLPKRPAWLVPEQLSPPESKAGGCLPPEAVTALCEMLAFTPLEPPYAGVEQVRESCTADSLARFSWDLFQLWRAADGSGKPDWCLLQLALFGDDETARTLTPLVRRWPGEARHQRAKKALDVLATIGTDVALMHLYGIGQKLKFKALKTAAAEKIEHVAQQRGLTPLELADRLVPDLDLEPDGTLTLDYGPRQFTVGFDESLKPFVRDASGKVLKSLPKPGKGDDAERAKAAKKRWSAMKKDARDVARTQITRVELVMTSRRRWEAGTFRTFLVEHPLLIHLVQRLVWGVYDDQGALTATFRVAEDRTMSDLDDEAFALPDDATVGVPHRIELDELGLANRWGEVFTDYEILQPFPQLGREVHHLNDLQKKGYALDLVQGQKVHFGKVVGLEDAGWRSGLPQEGGCVLEYLRPMGDDWEAELLLDPGIIAGDPSFEPLQELGAVVVRAKGTEGDAGRQKLSEVDPLLLSELIRDLTGLTR